MITFHLIKQSAVVVLMLSITLPLVAGPVVEKKAPDKPKVSAAPGLDSSSSETKSESDSNGEKPVHQALPEKYKLVTIGIAITQIKAEARTSWRDNQNWPRSRPNFAQDKEWRVDQDELIRGFTRRLNSNPAIDGYIKWQLLSFQPDFERVEPSVMNRIVANMPRVLDAAKPEAKKTNRSGGMAFSFFGRQTAYVKDLDPVVAGGVVAYKPKIGVTSSGSGVAAEGYVELHKTMVQANQKLKAANNAIQKANRPVITYRDAVLKRLSKNNAELMGMYIKEVRSRLMAGQESYKEAFAKLMQVGKKINTDPTVTAGTRSILAQWVAQMPKFRKTVVTGLDVKHERLIENFEVYELPIEDLKVLLGYVQNPKVPLNQEAK